MNEFAWGTDGVISIPEAMETDTAVKIDMEGFCFTPHGIRIDITEPGREELLGTGYGPMPEGRVHGD